MEEEWGREKNNNSSWMGVDRSRDFDGIKREK